MGTSSTLITLTIFWLRNLIVQSKQWGLKEKLHYDSLRSIHLTGTSASQSVKQSGGSHCCCSQGKQAHAKYSSKTIQLPGIWTAKEQGQGMHPL